MANISGLSIQEIDYKDREKKQPLKRRQRARFWRKITDGHGNLIWVQTLPLPSDPANRAIYEGKGFTLQPPTEVLVDMQDKEGIRCPVVGCDYIATGEPDEEGTDTKDRFAQLSSHLRSHTPKAEQSAEA